MEAIKLIGTSHNGKLTLSVPKEYDGKELELMIISSKKKDTHEILEKKRKRKELLSIAGTAKHPDFPMTKYDVYDQ